MATAGEITVTISISGNLMGGRAIASISKSKVYTSIADVLERDIQVPTSVTTLLTLGTLAAAGLPALNYLCIINTDSTNFVTLGLIDTGVKASYHRLDPHEHFGLSNDQFDANATGGAWASFTGIDTINAKADTAAVRLQLIAF